MTVTDRRARRDLTDVGGPFGAPRADDKPLTQVSDCVISRYACTFGTLARITLFAGIFPLHAQPGLARLNSCPQVPRRYFPGNAT
jgi:hypothetical protein